MSLTGNTGDSSLVAAGHGMLSAIVVDTRLSVAAGESEPVKHLVAGRS